MKRFATNGHTLVELLIAMGLSLTLMYGVVRAFSDSNVTFSVVVEQALMQENGRFAIGFIEQQVRRAGFISEIDIDKVSNENLWAQEFFPEVSIEKSTAVFPAGAVIVGLDNTQEPGEFVDGFRQGSDVLHLRYQRSKGSAMFRDCKGTVLDDDLPLTNTISLHVDKQGNLRCVNVSKVDGPRSSAVLVEGVDDMQILYGIDIDRQMPIQPEKYVTAQQIGFNNDGQSEWRDVVSLKLALLASSGSADRSFVRRPFAQVYEVFEQERNYDDGRIREVFQQTISLRNRQI